MYVHYTATKQFHPLFFFPLVSSMSLQYSTNDQEKFFLFVTGISQEV
jgi:hypothetical protein